MVFDVSRDWGELATQARRDAAGSLSPSKLGYR
jgi:hypothetical protein